MAAGIVAFVAATVSIISTRVSLPPYSIETEGKWTAYSLRRWAYLVWELPMSLILSLVGVLLWPPRPPTRTTKGLGAISLIIALIGLMATAYMAYSWMGMELNPSLPIVLAGIIVNFTPLLVMTMLAAAATRRLLR